MGKYLNKLFAPTVDVLLMVPGETGTFSDLRVKPSSAAGLGKGFQHMFNIYWIPYSAASVLFSCSFSRLYVGPPTVIHCLMLTNHFSYSCFYNRSSNLIINISLEHFDFNVSIRADFSLHLIQK